MTDPSTLSGLPFQAVLFDMDGTLVDTEPLWQAAEVALMQRHNTVWTDADQTRSLGGSTKTVANYMADLVAATGQARPDPGSLAGEFLDTMLQQLTTTPPPTQPGVAELLAAVKATGLPTALVTSSSAELMEAVLANIGRHWFNVTVNANDVDRHKPDPLPYLQAAHLLGVDPTWSLAIEDSPTGTAAASAAGCFVVAVEHMAPIDPAPRRAVVSTLDGVDVSWLGEQFQPPG